MTKPDQNGSWPALWLQLPDAWMAGAEAFASASQEFADQWAKKRSEQFQSNLDTWGRLIQCRDAGQAAEINWSWLQETVDRLGTEAREYQGQAMKLAQRGFRPAASDKSRNGAKAA